MLKKVMLCLLFQSIVFAQQIKLSGFVKDTQNRGIESASVLILDESKNTIAYTFTKNTGFFEFTILTRISIHFRIFYFNYYLILSV